MNTKGKVIPKILSKYVDFIENIFFFGRLEQFWEKLIEKAQISPNDRIIDIGCGSGRMVIKVSEQLGMNGEIIGLEPSKHLIKECNKLEKKDNVKFMEGIMESVPFPDNSFDIVLSSLAIHHVPKDDKQKAFKEFNRILKKGGRLLIMDHGKPYNKMLQVFLFPMRWNILEYQAENFRGEIPNMIKYAFGNVEEKARFYGWIKIWESVKEY